MSEYSEVIPAKPGFYVYRLWTIDETCLYVGCTGERRPKRLSSRLSDHRCKQPWWPEVARIDAAAFSGRDDMIAEEERQIVALNPVHNKRLRGVCAKGHDLTLPDAKTPKGRCRQCTNADARRRNQNPNVKAAHRRYWQKPEAKSAKAAYLRRWRRRPPAGQAPLW